VVADGETHSCDSALVEWLGSGHRDQPLLGGQDILASRADKAEAFAAHGASAIDLETGAVVRVARRYRATFAVLRAVCDPAARDLPPAALLALDTSGRIGGMRIAASLLQAPWQIVPLIALGRDAARARAALQRRVRTLIQSSYGA
jgi:adenosylhomocysteine nucleosidase